MAHFAFVAHGLTSPLNASLELSRRLRQAGHDVTFLSHAEIGAEVEASGFRFVQLTSQDELHRTVRVGAVTRPIDWFRRMRRARSQSITSNELETAIRNVAPDMLLIDIEMHYPIIATAALSVPTMLVMNWLSIFRVPGLPPLNTNLLPGDDRAIDRAWLRVRAKAIVARLRHKLGRGALGDLLRPVSYGTRFYADLKQVARARDYSLAENTDRKQWLRPYTYTRLPVICFNAYEFEFPHDPHPNIRYVGPMVNRNRPEGRVVGGDAHRWEEFKTQRLAPGAPPRPLIYCSLGSYWSDPKFLETVLTVFERRPEWDLVLGLGSQISPADLGPIPPNVLALGYAPQLEVLARANCSINHGGITSINECIVNEVPMIVYSPSLLDQDGCAARVAYHGLGISGDWNALNPSELEQQIQKVLTDHQIRNNLRTMKQSFDRYETDQVAVRTIEQHLAQSGDAQ